MNDSCPKCGCPELEERLHSGSLEVTPLFVSREWVCILCGWSLWQQGYVADDDVLGDEVAVS